MKTAIHPSVSGGSIKNNRDWFLMGMKNGLPIGLGYFAVSFTLGIAAKNVGLNPIQAALMSFLMHASAGQFAALTVLSTHGGFLTMILTQLTVNIRYVLMSCSLSQKIKKETPLHKRCLLAYFVTDEIFGISAGVKGDLNPFYSYGAASVASPGWVLGTFFGALMGNILPDSVASAFNVALYGMFLAVIIPESKVNKVVGVLVCVSMIISLLFTVCPLTASLSSSARIIILTILLASAAAIIRPIKEETTDEQ